MLSRMNSARVVYGVALLALLAGRAAAGPGSYLEYGTENLLGTGSYPLGAKDGATLFGLAPGVVSNSYYYFGHAYPFSPAPGDFPGTDQIYVGSVQTASHDGYSTYSGRMNGPMVLTMDYSSLVPAGQSVKTLTLGLATDDFQFPVYGQPFTATVNGQVDTALTNELNSLNETGPEEHFITIGISPSVLLPNKVLTVSINEGGDGGDGFAMDFVTVGVTTAVSVPEPSTLALACLGVAAASARRWRKVSAARTPG